MEQFVYINMAFIVPAPNKLFKKKKKNNFL